MCLGTDTSPPIAGVLRIENINTFKFRVLYDVVWASFFLFGSMSFTNDEGISTTKSVRASRVTIS